MSIEVADLPSVGVTEKKSENASIGKYYIIILSLSPWRYAPFYYVWCPSKCIPLPFLDTYCKADCLVVFKSYAIHLFNKVSPNAPIETILHPGLFDSLLQSINLTLSSVWYFEFCARTTWLISSHLHLVDATR